jgi:hypothetical protein
MLKLWTKLNPLEGSPVNELWRYLMAVSRNVHLELRRRDGVAAEAVVEQVDPSVNIGAAMASETLPWEVKECMENLLHPADRELLEYHFWVEKTAEERNGFANELYKNRGNFTTKVSATVEKLRIYIGALRTALESGELKLLSRCSRDFSLKHLERRDRVAEVEKLSVSAVWQRVHGFKQRVRDFVREGGQLRSSA